MNQKRVLRIEYSQQYPILSILVAVALIMAAPFVSVWLSYGAFAICLYRVLRYDAKVFATDYAILAPFPYIFSMPGGLTLLIILCLIATVVYFVREGVKADSAFVTILALLNYLIMRMQTNVNDFLLCFGQMCLLWVLLPKQDAQSAERTAKLYCISLLVASGYALLVNDTWQIQAKIGVGSEAFWGTGIMRLHGLVGDPNFYMTQLVVGIALLAKLRNAGRIKMLPFLLMGITMAVLGALTYSKTFLLVFVIFGVVYIIWQFRNKRILLGIALIVAVVLSAEFLLFSEYSPFAGVVSRLLESTDMDGLTTGRSEIYKLYVQAIGKSAGSFFFGYGLSAPGAGADPHNIYLEILYHCGAVGLVLIVAFGVSLVAVVKRQMADVKQSFIAKYVVLGMALMLFMTLNGLFMVVVYPSFFLGFLAILISPKESQ